MPCLPCPVSIRRKTYAAWSVWRDSTTHEVKFHPSAEEGGRPALAQGAPLRPPDPHAGQARRRRSGAPRLAVFYVLLFDFLDYATGCLDPSYDAIAAKAGVCRRAVADALHRLKTLGLLHWQRRCREDKDEAGRFRLTQETNAYASLPPSQWLGYHRAAATAAAASFGMGRNTLPCPIRSRRPSRSCGTGSARPRLAMLECDPGDQLAGALARLGRAILAPQS